MRFLKNIVIDTFYLLSFLILKLTKLKRLKYKLKGNETIYVLSFFRIGDNLFLTPIYRNIKNKYPNIKIAVLTNCRGAVNLLEHNPNIDRVKYLKDYWQGFNFVIRKNKNKPDVILDCSSNYYWSFIFSFLKPKKFRRGRENKQKIGHFLFKDFSVFNNQTIKYNNEYIVHYFLKIVDKMGVVVHDSSMDIYLDQKEIKLTLEKFDLINKNYIVLHIGADNPENIWNKWPNLVRLLLERYKDSYIVITGTDKDKVNADTIFTKGMREVKRVINLIGETSNLSEISVVIKDAKIYIGGDTGTTHIAIALKKKTIMLFGRADYKLYCPDVENVIPIIPKIDCYPCYTYKNCYQGCKYEKNICMDTIDEESIMIGIKKLEI